MVRCKCPLSGVKRTSQLDAVMSAYDPKRTLTRSVLGTFDGKLEPANRQAMVT
jgi:hypothetical protein